MRSADEFPDVATFNSLIGVGCTQRGDIKNAEDVSEKMRSAGELPDVVKFNSLIGGGCTQHGDTKKAEEICERMRSAGDFRTLRRSTRRSSIG